MSYCRIDTSINESRNIINSGIGVAALTTTSVVSTPLTPGSGSLMSMLHRSREGSQGTNVSDLMIQRLDLEEQRLKCEQERLVVKKQRLRMETARLHIELQRDTSTINMDRIISDSYRILDNYFFQVLFK